jgi:hypothetical protein
MLIEKGFAKGDVICLKLISNEEIVAKLVEQDANTVTVTKPLLVNISVDVRTGKPGLQMYPFFMLGAEGDEKLPLRRDHIIAMVASREDVKAGYIHNTTGIAIPSASDSGLIK